MLTCTNATARDRLARREIGSTLDQHIAASASMDARLRGRVASGTHQIVTDGRAVACIAADILDLSGWLV